MNSPENLTKMLGGIFNRTFELGNGCRPEVSITELPNFKISTEASDGRKPIHFTKFRSKNNFCVICGKILFCMQKKPVAMF
jgi:hypothetical protein